MGNLAITGGPKTIVTDSKHYVWPEISDKTKAAVLRQLDESISIYDRSGIIKKLEDRIATYHGKKHALLTNSGTAALHSMFAAAGLQDDDEVICPAYTFFATVTPLFSTGAIPVLADCRSDGNIDPADITRRITKKTKAIVVTHMWGLPCEMDRITDIARENGLMLLEDASHAHGARYQGNIAGTFGDAAAFSLQAQKTLTGGEGGVLVTDNDELFYRALLFGHYNKRCKQEIPRDHPLYQFAITGMGLKLRIHPLAAAVADEQMDNLDSILDGRRKCASKMTEAINDIPCLEAPRVPDGAEPSWYGFVMRYKPEAADGLPVDTFFKAAQAEGCIELDRPGSTCPLNQHALFQRPEELFPRYAGKLSYRPGDFPAAEEFHKQSLKLPVWHGGTGLASLYIDALKKVFVNRKELL